MNPNLFPALIFLAPFLAAVAIPFCRKSFLKCHIIAVLSIALTAALSAQALFSVSQGGSIRYQLGGWPPPFGIEWMIDPLTAVMLVLINTIAAWALLSNLRVIQKEVDGHFASFYIIVLLHVAALNGMIMTHDLFNLFVFIEVSSLTAYALISTGDRVRGNVASLRYLFIGTIGASFYLLGVGYLYSATGTLNMSDMAIQLQSAAGSRSVLTGIFLITLGLGIKAGLFPFHGWMPDAYANTSDSAASLMAPIMTKTVIYSIVRILYWSLPAELFSQIPVFTVLLIFGGVALAAGSVMAFFQEDFKRMLAYSSIAQIGLIFLAFGLREKTAFVGAVLHIIHHALMKACLFLIAGWGFYRFGIRKIQDLFKIKANHLIVLSAFAVAVLSMIGIPPFCGFFGKWYIGVGAFKAGIPVIAALVVGSSLLSALYFFKVVEIAYFKEPASVPKPQTDSGILIAGISLLAVLITVFGIFAPKIYAWGIVYLTPPGLY